MKTIFILTGLLISTAISFSQEIDSRILKNKGKEAEKIYEYNKNAYNYLVFELDHSYEIVPRSSLTREQLKQLNKELKLSDSDKNNLGTSNFNFYDLGIRLSKSERQYVLLDKDRVLVFFAIPEITKAFTTSPFNTK